MGGVCSVSSYCGCSAVVSSLCQVVGEAIIVTTLGCDTDTDTSKINTIVRLSLTHPGGTTVAWPGGRQKPCYFLRARMAASLSVPLSIIPATMSCQHGWMSVFRILSFVIRMVYLTWEVVQRSVVWHSWWSTTRRTPWWKHLGQWSTWNTLSMPPLSFQPTSFSGLQSCRNRIKMCMGRLASGRSLR